MGMRHCEHLTGLGLFTISQQETGSWRLSGEVPGFLGVFLEKAFGAEGRCL